MCDAVLAASLLEAARAELMAIISECMLRHPLAWWPPPPLEVRSNGIKEVDIALDRSGEWGDFDLLRLRLRSATA